MFAYTVLYSWPIAVFAFFRAWSPAVALLVSIIAGYLLLPVYRSVDLPGLPSLDKHTIPTIAAFISIFIIAVRNVPSFRPGWLPYGGIPKLLIIGLFVGAFLTVMTNGDALVYGPRYLPPLRPWDAFSTSLTTLFLILPLLLARKVLAGPNEHILLLKTLVISGALYSFLALFEVRMSPQLNIWIYGFFAAEGHWFMNFRSFGFRPVVFLEQGLMLAIFFAVTVLASFGLARILKGRSSLFFWLASAWLLMTLILAQSLGALLITLILLPVVLFFGPRGQLTIAATISMMILVYPMLRGAGLVPVEAILEWVSRISEQRADSFSYRLFNENLFLEKAMQRPLFGWGGWGRNFVISEETGENLSRTADGYWVILIGQGGWTRYLAIFGLLCLPIILLAKNARRYDVDRTTSVLSLVLVGGLIDLIPNATLTPIDWLMAGALWGRLELARVSAADAAAEEVADTPRKTTYARSLPSLPYVALAQNRHDEKSESIPYTRQNMRFVRKQSSSEDS